jgi:hypothetical protein
MDALIKQEMLQLESKVVEWRGILVVGRKEGRKDENKCRFVMMNPRDEPIHTRK